MKSNPKTNSTNTKQQMEYSLTSLCQNISKEEVLRLQFFTTPEWGTFLSPRASWGSQRQSVGGATLTFLQPTTFQPFYTRTCRHIYTHLSALHPGRQEVLSWFKDTFNGSKGTWEGCRVGLVSCVAWGESQGPDKNAFLQPSSWGFQFLFAFYSYFSASNLFTWQGKLSLAKPPFEVPISTFLWCYAFVCVCATVKNGLGFFPNLSPFPRFAGTFHSTSVKWCVIARWWRLEVDRKGTKWIDCLSQILLEGGGSREISPPLYTHTYRLERIQFILPYF